MYLPGRQPPSVLIRIRLTFFAAQIIVAQVKYERKIEDDEANVASADGLEVEELEGGVELWDMLRPLIGDCELRLLKFEDRDAKAVLWHSSAHCLGYAMERCYGCHLTHGPPIENGFFYDAYMGSHTVTDKDYKEIEKMMGEQFKAKQTFDRVVLTKEQALEMFKYNPFKTEFISTRIPDGGVTTVYRNGDFIDLCRGPHVPYSTAIQAHAVLRHSASYWLGKADNDSLQRIYGIAFPEKKAMQKWKEFQEEAKKRDHRVLGQKQKLFFFNPLSPGSAFFLPHGTRLYNRLMEFIRKEYWKRGYEEVTTPNVFNMDLWEKSGHAQHYRENMFRFDVEGQEFGMKPMNCPGHCLMFNHEARSWRELPLRLADFGVLHRNELSGALTGLTRVRRFCQDDAHIFCRKDQIKEEVLGSLDFMKTVYDIFGMSYKLELSTKPAKALGDDALWVEAEASLAEALDEFAGKGNWRENPGDGAFYGPKIDIKVFDAMERVHQCATVQLDFQLPIRFDLKYVSGSSCANAGAEEDVTAESNGAPEEEDASSHMERPVMVHRAMLGSVERMIAVLIEHYGGKWPFWLSPRQVMIVPVAKAYNDFALDVRDRLHNAGFYVDAELSNKTLNKKVRESQVAQYSFILVVGEVEMEKDEVNVRGVGQSTVSAFIEQLQQLTAEHK